VPRVARIRALAAPGLLGGRRHEPGIEQRRQHSSGVD
jgi:hypothetical protein